MKIGIGYDVHRFIKDRDLILGGIKIPYEKGLDGHSDADVLAHAIMDALIGAAKLGDIGVFFPDTDPKYKNANSLELLKQISKKIKKEGFEIDDIDSVIIAQEPKITPYREGMRKKLAKAMDISKKRIGIKATTTEKLGYTGKGKGIAAEAVVLLKNRL